MQCPSCNKVIRDDSNFCPFCGNALETSPATNAESSIPPSDLQEDALFFAKGINGQVTLLEDQVRIERKGAWSFVTFGFRGTKEILVSEISSVEYRNAGSVLS